MKEIRKTFPGQESVAIAVAGCESGYKMIQSHHQQPYGREESFGIFQIHAKAWEEVAQNLGLKDYKTNVEQNIEMARHVYEQSGWDAWTCYWHEDHLAMR